jgi:hypothetical protein
MHKNLILPTYDDRPFYYLNAVQTIDGKIATKLTTTKSPIASVQLAEKIEVIRSGDNLVDVKEISGTFFKKV